MFNQPSVSVIIVNYNGKNFICDCIDSVLQTDYPSFEIVVVDNGSTNGSYELLQKNYEKNEKMRIIKSQENLYFTGGSNLGAKLASGEKLIFLNSDTVVTRNWLKELIYFSLNPPKFPKPPNFLVQPKILIRQLADPKSPKFLVDNAGGRYLFPGFGVGIGRGKVDRGQYDKNFPVDFVNGTCFLIDKEFFEKLGGFDETYHFFYEDIDLCLRAKKQGGQCFCCGKSVIYHQRGQTIKTTLSQEEVNFYIRKNRRRTIEKNFRGFNKFLRLANLSPAELTSTRRLSRARLLIKPTHQGLINYLRFWELKKFLKKKKFTLLDLGCGDGEFVRLARRHGIDALGVDKKAPCGPNFSVCNIEDLQLAKKFDVITMFHVLEHVKKPEKVLRKALTFLKEDGVLVIEVPLVGNLTEKFLGKNYFAYHDQTHFYFFKKREIYDLLAKVNLRVKKKGLTLFQFPFTVLTTSFKQGLWQSLKAIILFVPLKLLSIFGANDEIIRLYCRKEAF
ncbi:MAG: methyltransferase domain-containing protein [Candidatus Cloacimonetes bacterium]|nr:methyltransferase domain-containing protein [Candidatus Cloacimonadota bacterium]